MTYQHVCYCGRSVGPDFNCPHDGGELATAALRLGRWQTPGGQTAYFYHRAGTSDWNTVSAILVNPFGGETGDEYGLPAGLTGWALDIGAHIGGATVGLLLDNPELRVVAIEAVPDNADLLRRNLAENGVADRCVVMEGAAWKGRGTIEVEYGYTGSEVAEVHAYIGSVTKWIDAPGKKRTARVPRYTLADAIRETDGQGFAWVKSDCEGCEHHFLRGPLLAKVGTISGEWHHRDGTPEAFSEQLSKTHTVSWGQGIGGGPFRAVPK